MIYFKERTCTPPDANAFNKAQAFKWEKGMDATIKIGSAIGSALAFGAIGGPLGFAAAPRYWICWQFHRRYVKKSSCADPGA